MNQKQRRVLKVAMLTVVLMVLFPPIYYPRDSDNELAFHGYGLIFKGWDRIETDLLLVQSVAVAIIAFIAYRVSDD
jgi:Ca2+/H+ antiporter